PPRRPSDLRRRLMQNFLLPAICLLVLIASALPLLPAAVAPPVSLAEAGDGGMAVPSRPLVIAHRGASGYLPELTLEAFTLAHAQGADMVETDVLLTRDGQLVNLHDLTLNRTTNVEEVFPDRAG